MATAVHTDDPQRTSLGSNGQPLTGTLPFTFDDFPLLPHGSLLWSDSAGNVANLADLVPRLPDCLITLTAASRNGAALIVGGAVADAVWADRSRSLVGTEAFTALAKSRVGTVAGFSIEDHRLVQAMPALWRCPRTLTGLPADWLDADKLIRSIRADGQSCALLIEAPVRGAALFADGELVASYTEKRRRPSATTATLRALLHTPGTRLTVVSPTELPPDSALGTLVASVTGGDTSAAAAAPAATPEPVPAATDAGVATLSANPPTTVTVDAEDGAGDAAGAAELEDGSGAEPFDAASAPEQTPTWSIRAAADGPETVDLAAATAPPAPPDGTGVAVAAALSAGDLTEDDDLDAIVGGRVLERFPADAPAPPAFEPPQAAAEAAPPAFLAPADDDGAPPHPAAEAAPLDVAEPFTLTSEQSAPVSAPADEAMWEPAPLPVVQEEELSFAPPEPAAPPAVVDEVFTFAPITFPDPTEHTRLQIPSFEAEVVGTFPTAEPAADDEDPWAGVAALNAEAESEIAIEDATGPTAEVNAPAEAETETETTLEAEAGAESTAEADTFEPDAEPLGLVDEPLQESDPLDDEDFVPTRLDIDIDGLRAELIDIATVWLGADDIAPVTRLIGRARPGVDEFVNAIAAVGALQIPGHETAVVRAMAREMHFRAAEVLCGV